MEDAARVLPVEAWTNGRHGTILCGAYADQVTIVAPNGTVIEIERDVFRGMFTRLVIASYSTPRRPRCSSSGHTTP